MPTYKVVIRYKFANRGWTEVFYKTSALTADLVAQLTPNVVNTSLACRHPLVVLQSATASDVSSPRVAAKYTFNEKAPGVSNATPDVTNVAARLNLAAVGGGNRKLWVRGLNDTWTIRDAAGNDTPAPALLNRLDNYVQTLIGQQYAIQRAVGRTPNPFIQVASVSGKDVGGRMWLNIQLAPPQTYTVGTKIYLSGFNQRVLGGARGVFTVIEQTPPSFTVNYPWDLGALVVNVLGARVRRLQYEYPLIADGQFEQLSTHDTGRPTDLPRGRRRGLIVRR